MATPNEKLADSLQVLAKLQSAGHRVVRPTQITRTHRERLAKAGYLREIVKGWLMPTRPEERLGDTTAWFASMRDFIRGYCDQRFDAEWSLSPELSLLVQTGVTALPPQIQVHTPKGKNNNLRLPEGTSLFDYRAKDWPGANSTEIAGDLRAMTLPTALVRASATFFERNPDIARQALWQLRGASELNATLLEGSRTVVAGRLVGALRAVGRPDLADEVLATMRVYSTVTETNPFVAPVSNEPMVQESPYAMRIRTMWAELRNKVISIWRDGPETLPSADEFLAIMEERYVADAYHSLSIEGYQVSAELIERVRVGQWNPDADEQDKQQRNAMAAKGYDLAHKEVRKSVRAILEGANAGKTVRGDHGGWYRALFTPSVQVGLLRPSDLAGYRNSPVYIRNSMHTPLPKEAVRDAMPTLFDLLENEPSGSVRAVLGHFIFVFIHPYMDGNGRIGRLLMNTMLASGGYPWTIVTLGVRNEYMAALEDASVRQDIAPFAELIYRLMREQRANAPRPNE